MIHRFARPGHARGMTLLECALGMPVVIILICGALDITNIMRARSAAREGVRTALRCLSATDACADAAGGETLAEKRLFHVYAPEGGTVREIGVQRYATTASYLEAVRYRTELSATVLDRVVVPAETFRFRAARVSYPAQRVAEYQVRTLPFVRGDVAARTFEVVAARRDGARAGFRGSSEPAPLLASRNATTTLARAGDRAALHFTVPRSEPVRNDIPCMTRTVTQGTPLPERCDSWRWFPARDGMVPIVLSVRGESPRLPGIQGPIQGVVELSLRWPGGGVSLGGQRFLQRYSSNGEVDTASFIPRGAPRDYVASPLLEYSETEIHQPLYVPADTQITVEASMKTQNTSWTLEGVDVYGARVTTEKIVEDCRPLNACELATRDEVCRFSLDLPSVVVLGEPRTEQKEFGCRVAPPTSAELLDGAGCPSDPYILASRESCGITPVSSLCGDNHGVSDEPRQGVIVGSDAAQRLCPLRPETAVVAAEYGAIAEPVWIEKHISLPPITATKRECGSEVDGIAALRAAYPKITVLGEQRVGSEVWQPSVPMSWSEIAASNRFKCDAFPVRQLPIEASSFSTGDATSTLLPRYDGCSDGASQITERLRTDLAVPSHVGLTTVPIAGSEEWQRVSSSHTLSPCTPYRVYVPADAERRYLGEYADGVLPEECTHVACAKVLSRIERSSADEAQQSDLKALAIQVARRAVTSTFPKLQFESGSTYGFDVEVESTESANEVDIEVMVPSILMQHTVTVHAEDRLDTERSLIR